MAGTKASAQKKRPARKKVGRKARPARIVGLKIEDADDPAGPPAKLLIKLPYEEALILQGDLLEYLAKNRLKWGSPAHKKAAARIEIDLTTGDVTVHKDTWQAKEPEASQPQTEVRLKGKKTRPKP